MVTIAVLITVAITLLATSKPCRAPSPGAPVLLSTPAGTLPSAGVTLAGNSAAALKGLPGDSAFQSAARANWTEWRATLFRRTMLLVRGAEEKARAAAQPADHARFDIFSAYLSCPKGEALKRVGGSGDGGKLVCPSLIEGDGCVIYSLGSAGNTKFESDLLQQTQCQVGGWVCAWGRGAGAAPRERSAACKAACMLPLGCAHARLSAPCSWPCWCAHEPHLPDPHPHGHRQPLTYLLSQIVTFDCTSGGGNMGDRHRFVRKCLGDDARMKQDPGNWITLARAMEDFGHKTVTLLKMDIEGFEYDVFSQWGYDAGPLPQQISFEVHYKGIYSGSQFHNRDDFTNLLWPKHETSTAEMALLVGHLANMGYGIVSREDNAECPYCSELTLLRVALPHGGS